MMGGTDLGWKLEFTLTAISPPGAFHTLCVRKHGFSAGIPVVGGQLKVNPPVLLSVEPPMVWSGRSVLYRLTGIGLTPGDQVRVVDGEAHQGCLRGGALPGGGVYTLGGGTTQTETRIEAKFEVPGTHARFCYRPAGVEQWEEIGGRLTNRASGYIYGSEGTLHPLVGPTPQLQKETNVVYSGNQTVSILPPRAVNMLAATAIARESQLFLEATGNGMTETGKWALVPLRVQCGGTAATRSNLIQDGTGVIGTRLRSVQGGETRYPTIYDNDPVTGYEKLSQCSGSRQVEGCTVELTSANGVGYPTSIDISEIGRANVCYMYRFASEYSLVGTIGILPPFVKSVSPLEGIMLNKPFVLTIRGTALADTDVVKAVMGTTCQGPISSRPYYSRVVITDQPYRTKAEVTLVLTGPG